MISESNFVVRVSGKKENSYYIDYLGVYKVTEIAKLVGIDAPTIKEEYVKNGACYEELLDVYYFGSIDEAKNTIREILRSMKSEHKGRAIFLSEAEIEYIRKALINDGSNTLLQKRKIKDEIFKKLNA